MNIPSDLRYSTDHEWVKVAGDVATLGVTDYAQHALGDIVFLELPEVGQPFVAGDTIGVVESVKAASDIYTPVSGEVVESHEDLIDMPEILNAEPYGAGWLLKIKLDDPSEIDALMDAAAYEKYCGEQEEK
ncbi:MAG: glycine cleavage system protein GcvH [Candidatus Lernaella stagnicola]|nr:glycine cleavage system protein GcvH [Candidatus Lernaella stagnicola]